MNSESHTTEGRSPGLLVCDLDGVVYLEDDPVPGAREAIQAIRDAGWRVLFATNNATRTTAELVQVLADRGGVMASESEVVSSAMAAVSLIDEGPVLVVGERGLVATVREAGLEVTADPDHAATVVVGLDRDLSYEKLAAAVTAVLGGATFIAANHDPSFPTPAGLRPGGGAIAAAIATASGRQPIYAGKPEAPIRDLILDRVDEVEQIWVVGDRPDADIALARASGWRSALVLTGVVADASQVPDDFQPDVVIESIADLPRVMGVEPDQGAVVA